MEYPQILERESINEGNKLVERRSNSVQSTLELLDPQLQRLEVLAHQIQEMGDRVNGGRPRPAADPAPSITSTSAISLLQTARNRLDRLKQAIDMVERELRALSEGLWAD